RISDQRYHLGKQIIKIDHHPNHDPYGDIRWVNTDASSTSEMIYELFKAGEKELFRFNNEASRRLYSGMVDNTGLFLFPSTRYVTFRYAAELIEYSFNRSALYDGMYQLKPSIARLKGHVLQHFTMSKHGVSSITLTKEILEKFGVTPVETSKLVGALGDIEGIKSWVFFIE